jgi:hypothetical protein
MKLRRLIPLLGIFALAACSDPTVPRLPEEEEEEEEDENDKDPDDNPGVALAEFDLGPGLGILTIRT